MWGLADMICHSKTWAALGQIRQQMNFDALGKKSRWDRKRPREASGMQISTPKALAVNAWPKPKPSLSIFWLTATCPCSIRKNVSTFRPPNSLIEQYWILADILQMVCNWKRSSLTYPQHAASHHPCLHKENWRSNQMNSMSLTVLQIRVVKGSQIS